MSNQITNLKNNINTQSKDFMRTATILAAVIIGGWLFSGGMTQKCEETNLSQTCTVAQAKELKTKAEIEKTEAEIKLEKLKAELAK